jgi:phage tail protein X
MVQDGDTVERLARRIYGLSDEKTIERIQKSNPELKDINLIFPGQILFFPLLEEPG